MYRYIIEQHVGPGIVPWRLLSNDKQDVGDWIRLNHAVTWNQDGDEAWPSIQDSHGIIADSEPVREGAILDGATVFRIYQDTVEFEQDGKRWTQKVNDPYPA